MTTQAIPAIVPSLGNVVASWLRPFGEVDAPTSRVTPDETRARRDFVREMLDRNASAVSGEMDFQTMMLVYPGRF